MGPVAQVRRPDQNVSIEVGRSLTDLTLPEAAKLRFFEQLPAWNFLPPVLPNPGWRELKQDRAES